MYSHALVLQKPRGASLVSVVGTARNHVAAYHAHSTNFIDATDKFAAMKRGQKH